MSILRSLSSHAADEEKLHNDTSSYFSYDEEEEEQPVIEGSDEEGAFAKAPAVRASLAMAAAGGRNFHQPQKACKVLPADRRLGASWSVVVTAVSSVLLKPASVQENGARGRVSTAW